MQEQMAFIEFPQKKKSIKSIKRRWENEFQRWSDKHGMDCDNTESYGCCGYGAMCDWCYDDVGKGRPCVRALNAMCREKGLLINYGNKNFEEVWRGMVKR